jgi:hypothetical protein
MTSVERRPRCREPIGARGCACLSSKARPARYNQTGRTDLDPDNRPDDVGFVEDDHLEGIREPPDRASRR